MLEGIAAIRRKPNDKEAKDEFQVVITHPISAGGFDGVEVTPSEKNKSGGEAMEKACSQGNAGETEGPYDELDDGGAKKGQPSEGRIGEMKSDVGRGVIRFKRDRAVRAGHRPGYGNGFEQHDDAEENPEGTKGSAADVRGENLRNGESVRLWRGSDSGLGGLCGSGHVR